MKMSWATLEMGKRQMLIAKIPKATTERDLVGFLHNPDVYALLCPNALPLPP